MAQQIAMFVDFSDCGDDVIHVGAFAEKDAMLQPDGFAARPLSGGTKRRKIGVIDRPVIMAASHWATVRIEILIQEHGVPVKRMGIAGGARNAFTLESGDKILAGIPEFGFIEAEHIYMERMPRDVGRHL
jgi:hypothetical protein